MFSQPVVNVLVISALIALFLVLPAVLAVRKRKPIPSEASLLDEVRRARAAEEEADRAAHWKKRENGLVTRLVAAFTRAAQDNPPARIQVIELPERDGQRRILVYAPGLNAHYWGHHSRDRVSYCDPIYSIIVEVNEKKQAITLSMGGASDPNAQTFHENDAGALIANLARNIRTHPPVRLRAAN